MMFVLDQVSSDVFQFIADSSQSKSFKLIKHRGIFFPYCYIASAPAYTAPGHSNIFSMTVPHYHYIISNYWYNKFQHKKVSAINYFEKNIYTQKYIGRLWQFIRQEYAKHKKHIKIFVLSQKHKAALLSAGRYADNYFYLSKQNQLQARKNNSTYKQLSTIKMKLPKLWRQTFLPVFPFRKDKTNYEVGINHRNVFPYKVDDIMRRFVPHSNYYLMELAKHLIQQYHDDMFIVISLSTPDFIGHRFGPYSAEMKETLLTIDNYVYKFISFIKRHYDYTLFITADHGSVPAPTFLKEFGINSYAVKTKHIATDIQKCIKQNKIDNQVIAYYFPFYYVAKTLTKKHFKQIKKCLLKKKYIAYVFSRYSFPCNKQPCKYYANGYTHYSGDVIVQLKPYIPYSIKIPLTSVHYSTYDYDARVFFGIIGSDIKQQTIYRHINHLYIGRKILSLVKKHLSK